MKSNYNPSEWWKELIKIVLNIVKEQIEIKLQLRIVIGPQYFIVLNIVKEQIEIKLQLAALYSLLNAIVLNIVKEQIEIKLQR